VEDIKTINENSIDLKENAEDSEQNNITTWTVTGMLIIWIYVIIMSLF
jgi:hypothetical protein